MAEETSRKITKSFVPSMCPHCTKEVYVVFQSSSPALQGIVNLESIEKAKESLKTEIKNIKFKDAEYQKMLTDWLDREDTVIDDDDVVTILGQIKEVNA